MTLKMLLRILGTYRSQPIIKGVIRKAIGRLTRSMKNQAGPMRQFFYLTTEEEDHA